MLGLLKKSGVKKSQLFVNLSDGKTDFIIFLQFFGSVFPVIAALWLLLILVTTSNLNSPSDSYDAQSLRSTNLHGN